MSEGTRPKASMTAFAPATVANVAVGFDILGFAISGAGDRATVTREPGDRDVRIESIEGVVRDLPLDPTRNTATVALQALLDDRGLAGKFSIQLHKGIPLGSGMGGSAASAVAAVVAANALLDRPLAREELLPYAVLGERAASGASHADNAAPCLLGGLSAVVSHDPLDVVSIPLPETVIAVVVRPHLAIETRAARAALPREIPLDRHVAQAMALAGFLAGCFQGDLARIGRSMRDLIAEPARATLIPGFERARIAALERGAIGFAIAGSGPSVFAWAASPWAAREIESAIRAVFAEAGVGSDGIVGPIERKGARVLEGGREPAV